MNSTNIEIGVITDNRKFRLLDANELKEHLDDLEWFYLFVVCYFNKFNWLMKLNIFRKYIL